MSPDEPGGEDVSRPAADRAIAADAARPEKSEPVQPVDSDWTPERTGPPAAPTAAEPADEGLLESIGRAVSAPMRDAAASDEAAQTGGPPADRGEGRGR